ncbi:acyl-CoA dehydrogenase family member 10-like [Aplochiton taeniatus]
MRHNMKQAPSHYKAVIFDMYGVLLPSPVALATVFEQKNRVPLGTVGRAIRAGGDDNVWKSFMRGQLGAKDFIEAFSTQCSEIAGCTVHIGPFYAALTSGQMSRPIPLMLDAVHSIRQRGLKTALLTNNFQGPDGQPYQPLDPSLFDVVVESVKEGVSKPDRRIFERCLARLGVASRDAIFLDDLIFNVQAAAQLGIRVIQVKEPAVAVKELEEALSFPLCRTESRLPVSESRDTGPSAPLARDVHTHYLKSLLHLTETDALRVQPLSMSLYLLDNGGRQFLFRTQQEGKHILETEHRVLSALSGSGLPVPKIIKFSEDSRCVQADGGSVTRPCRASALDSEEPYMRP